MGFLNVLGAYIFVYIQINFWREKHIHSSNCTAIVDAKTLSVEFT